MTETKTMTAPLDLPAAARECCDALGEYPSFQCAEIDGHRHESCCQMCPKLLALARRVEAATAKRCAEIARNPYSDEVQTIGEESPLNVGRRIAAAIKAEFKGGEKS